MKITKEELLKMYEDGARNFEGTDLSGLWLTKLDLSNAIFTNCDMRGTNFAKTMLTGCNFDGSDLRGTNLDYAELTGTSFNNVTLNWKTSCKNTIGNALAIPEIDVPTDKAIIKGDITTVSEEVWANEWRVHAPDKENVLSFGGSFIGDLFSVNHFACTLESINDKKGDKAKEQRPKNTASFDAGHLFEPYVAESFKRYMEAEGHTVELIADTNMYQHPLHPYILADMDYLCKVDGELCILECKTCASTRKDEVERLQQRILNDAYFLQTNLYLSVAHLINSEIKTCYLADMWGFRATDSDMAVIKITRNEEYEANLYANLDAMYEAIKNEEEIDLSHLDPTALSDYYRRYFGIPETEEEREKCLTLSASVRGILDEIILLQNERKEYDDKSKEIKEVKLPEKYNQLSPLFGGSLHGILNIEGTKDYYKVDRDPFERSATLDTEMLIKEFPLDAKRYSKKIFRSTEFESLLEDLKNGSISVDEYIQKVTVEDTFDEDEFMAENKKNSKVVAPFTKCYYKLPKKIKDGTEKPVDVFKVKMGTWKK